MENIPERLVKIEEEAKKIVQKAKDSKIGTSGYLEKQKAIIEAAFYAESDKIIRTNYESEMKKQKEEIKAAESQLILKKTQMKRFYEDNKEKWIQEIYDNIIGR